MDLVCDRCGKHIEGFNAGDFTAGYYDVTGYWGKYANKDEKVVCDECMWKDFRYQVDYGVTQ